MIVTSAGSAGFLDYYEAKYAVFQKINDHLQEHKEILSRF